MGIALNCKFFYTFTPHLPTFFKIYIILGPGKDWHSPKNIRTLVLYFGKSKRSTESIGNIYSSGYSEYLSHSAMVDQCPLREGPIYC